MEKQYHLNQSPLYKLRSFKRLAKILDCPQKSLEKLLLQPNNNYYTSHINQEKIIKGSKQIVQRKIQVPKPQLNRIHKKVQKFLSKIEKPGYLFSGVKRRSNVSNALYHVETDYMRKMDIQKYYEKTSAKYVYKCFVNTFRMAPDLAKVMTKLCTFNSHIPTGSSLSQNLAFFCNLHLFNQIESFCKKRKISFSLYVDDLTFSAKHKLTKDLTNRIVHIFNKNSDYVIHKFQVYNKETPKLVTGVILKNNIMLVPNKLRVKMLNHDKEKSIIIDNLSNDRDGAINFYQRFIGLVSCANQISPNYKLWTKELCEERKKYGIQAVTGKKD
ncbi:reverse transcriptase family protein [Paraglaciecola arctica]|uniref:reverse transcriptase family protein n=1 Tax=Paraglaciecola arctica TaxID=1128911 RepID=UPI001C068C59|nr:reverse transcriptase family protein [Paraglaciecola arctica]MBU3005933.1 reverse transcriptase family protein [Paraglaciecola arctica]